MYFSEVEVDLAKIRTNFQRLQRAFPGRIMAPVLKSDAYGHGAGHVAAALAKEGCRHFCVFSVDEARQLRQSGVAARLWLLGGMMDGEGEEAAELADNAAFALWDSRQLAGMVEAAERYGVCFDVHIAVDTGMNRLGFYPRQLPAVLSQLAGVPGIRVAGAFSHLASADNPDSVQTDMQVMRFHEACSFLPDAARELHLCATPGMMAGVAPQLHYMRPGFAIYGYGHDSRRPDLSFEPAMSFRSRIISLKRVPAGESISYSALYTVPDGGSMIAVVPVGYANGYPRCLENKAHVLVRGRRAPVRGRICMGMLMADVSGIPGVECGDEVTLLGRQGGEAVSGEELAALAGTVPYEILCALGKEPHRRFVNG